EDGRPEEERESVLEEGSGGAVGTESPRPDEDGLASPWAGKAALGAGKGLARLGQALGSGKLAGLGAGLIGKALSLAPRLSEELLGRQAAALRDLLREFREGDVDRALRRALPLQAPGQGPGADA